VVAAVAASIVAKMVIDHSNVPNREKVAVVVVQVVENDQVSYSILKNEKYEELLFSRCMLQLW